MKRSLVATAIIALLVVGLTSVSMGAIEDFEGYTDATTLASQGWTAMGGASGVVSTNGAGHDGVTALGLSGFGANWTNNAVNQGVFKTHGVSLGNLSTLTMTMDVRASFEATGPAGAAVARIGFTNSGVAAGNQFGFFDGVEVYRQVDYLKFAHFRNASGSAGGAGYAETSGPAYNDGNSPIADGEWLKVTFIRDFVAGQTSVDIRSYADLNTSLFSNTASHNFGAVGDNFDAIWLNGWQGNTYDNINVVGVSLPEPSSVAVTCLFGFCATRLCGRRHRANA